MIGWLWRMVVGHFTSCRHDHWTTVKRGSLLENGSIFGNFAIQQCDHCGIVKYRKLY